jgi:hypothetical protein
MSLREARDEKGNAAELALVLAASREGNLARAEALLDELEARYPMDEEVWILRASLAPTDQEAARHLACALELNPRNEKALRNLSLLRLGTSSRTHSALHRALPERNTCRLCRHSHNGAFETCKSCGIVDDLSRFQEMLNNPQAIPEVVSAAIQRRVDKATANALASAAIGAVNLGDLGLAVELACRAVEVEPDNRDANILVRRLAAPQWLVAVGGASPVLRAVMKVMDRLECLVKVAASGGEARAAIDSLTPRAVLIDSGSGSFGVCRTLRADAASEGIPIFVLGAGIAERVKARAADANGCIPVPFTSDSLVSVLGPYYSLPAAA